MNTTFSKPSLVSVLKTGGITAVIAAVANLVVWFVGGLFGTMVFPFVAVILSTIVFVVLGSLVYWVLTRVAGARAARLFTIIGILFMVLYAYGPIGAMSNETMPGMGLFNTPTVIAAEIMHLIAGVLAITRIPKAA